MQNDTDTSQNVIRISDPFAVARHLNYLARIGLHCTIKHDREKEMNGRFVSVTEEKMIINLLADSGDEPEKMTPVTVEYRLDNILHSYNAMFLSKTNDDVHLSLPESVLRFQIRRYDRVKVSEDKELEVKFNLMPHKTTVQDISIGGIGLYMDTVPENFERNIRLNSIKLMLKKDRTMHLSGILRYVKAVDDDDKHQYRIGVEFDPLKEDDKSTLLDFLDDLDT